MSKQKAMMENVFNAAEHPAERNATRVLGLIHEARRERESRDAAARIAKKRGVAKRLTNSREPTGDAGSAQLKVQSSSNELSMAPEAERLLQKILHHILFELLRLCGNAAVESKDFFIEPVHIKSGVMKDREMSALFSENLLNNADGMSKKAKKIDDKATSWYKAIPAALKQLHPDLGIADSSRMMISYILTHSFDQFAHGSYSSVRDMQAALCFALPAKMSEHFWEIQMGPRRGKVRSGQRHLEDQILDVAGPKTIDSALARASSRAPSAKKSTEAFQALPGPDSDWLKDASDESGARALSHDSRNMPVDSFCNEQQELPPRKVNSNIMTRSLAQLHSKNADGEHHQLDVLLEVSHPRGLAQEEEAVWKSELQKWNEMAAPKPAPPLYKWHAKEVKISHKMLKNLTNADMEVLSSFERPPHIVERVMLAVHELLEIRNHSWAGMRKMMAVDLSVNSEQSADCRPHQIFKAALDECSTSQQGSGRRPNEKAAGYPAPIKGTHESEIIKRVLAYTGHERDPAVVLKNLSKYTSDPEFTPENAGVWSKAALALCVWVRAVGLHFKEIKRMPGRSQIEKAISSGAQFLQSACNTRVEDWLPDIASKANKDIGTKSYHDLVQSRHNLVRKVFHRPPPKMSADFHEAPDTCEQEGFVRDIDLRASYQSCKAGVLERLQARQLAAKEQPMLRALCKFDHPAFASEAAGRRSWERYRDIDLDEVRFEDGAPRPKSVERDAKRADQLNKIYQSDVLMRRMVQAIGKNDHETVQKLVLAGADLEWTDDHGRTVFDIAKELRMLPCLKMLDTCQLRLRQARRNSTLSPSKHKKTKPVVLPRLSLAIPPRSQHGKRRKPIKVLTYRQHVAVVEDKYKLQDPNEYVTESEESSSEEEEKMDREEKLALNRRRFVDVFVPPLTPHVSTKQRHDEDHSCDDILDAQEASGGTGNNASLEPAVDGSLPEVLNTQVSDEQRLDGHAGGDADAQGEDTSSTTFLTNGEGAGQLLTVGESDGAQLDAENTRDHEYFDKKEHGRTRSKKELFDILHGGMMKGGIDDLSITSKQHEYLRRCQAMGIMPRPLVFGQADPEHINLKRFGLNGKQGQALAVALEGLETCRSLSLSENRLGEDGVKAICQVLRDNKALTVLDLSSVEIRNKVSVVTDLLKRNQSIIELNLAGNDIPDRALAELLNVVNATKRLQRLNISRNFCGMASSDQLLAVISKSRLSVLNVSWMSLRLPFVQGLPDALIMNKHLTVLNLSHNGLCDESASLLAQIWLDAVYEPASAMVLQDLDLGHNRIQKKGALCLALAVEKVAQILRQKLDKAPFAIERIVLNGNSIGEVGVRACLHTLGFCEVEWVLHECLLDSACEDFFERGLVEKSYELDMSELHDRLVAEQLVLISNSRFEGQRIIQSAIFEGKELHVADTGDTWIPFDFDPMYYDDGLLEMTLDGPWKSFMCRFIGQEKNAGACFDIITALELTEYTDDNQIRKPVAKEAPVDALLAGKTVYIECADGTESGLSLVKSYSRVVEVDAIFEEMYEEVGSEDVQGDQLEGSGEVKKVFKFRMLGEERGEWKVIGFPIMIQDATGMLCQFETTEEGIYLHLEQLVDPNSRPPEFQCKHEKVKLRYSLLTLCNLDQDVCEVLAVSSQPCTCWYVDAAELSPMVDEMFHKTIPVLKKVLKFAGEDRLLAFVRALSKDLALSAAQAEVVALLFLTEKYQKLAYTILGGDEHNKMPKKIKRRKASKDENLTQGMQAPPLQAMSGAGGSHSELTLLGGQDGAFFDLFGGILWLVRQEDHVAEQWLEDTQERLRQVEAECETAMDGLRHMERDVKLAGGKGKEAKKRRELHGAITHQQQQVFKLKAERDELAQKACKRVIALVISVKESPLPDYAIDTLCLTCREHNREVKAYFKVVDVTQDRQLMLLQDPAVRSSDGSSAKLFSLLNHAPLGQRCQFEFPSRAAAAMLDGADGDYGILEEETNSCGDAGESGVDGMEGHGTNEKQDEARVRETDADALWDGVLDKVEMDVNVGFVSSERLPSAACA